MGHDAGASEATLPDTGGLAAPLQDAVEHARASEEAQAAIRQLPVERLQRLLEIAASRDALMEKLVVYAAQSPPDTIQSSMAKSGSSSPVRSAPLAATPPLPPPTLPNAAMQQDTALAAALANIDSLSQTSDEFRMYIYKVVPCSNHYNHSWNACPYTHPSENARRRDPRRFKYVAVACPYHKAGACMMGEACPYSHGVFEVNLHPCKYRTEFCRDGPNCTRTVCFFAHHPHELRKPQTECCPTPEEFAAAEGVRAQQVKAALAPNSAIQGMIDTALQDAIPQLHNAGGANSAKGAGDRQAIALRQLAAQPAAFRNTPPLAGGARRMPLMQAHNNNVQRQMSLPVSTSTMLPPPQPSSFDITERFLSLDLDHLSQQLQWNTAAAPSLLGGAFGGGNHAGGAGTNEHNTAFAAGPLWAQQSDSIASSAPLLDAALVQQLRATGRTQSGGDASSASGFATPVAFSDAALLQHAGIVGLPTASEGA